MFTGSGFPMRFADHTIMYICSERADGVRTLEQAERIWLEGEVEKKAQPKPKNRPPRYPDERGHGQNGEVCAAFVVGTTGRAIMNTFKILSSTNSKFSESVRTAVGTMEFYPAEVHQHAVPQLVHMPFGFYTSINAMPDSGSISCKQ